MGNLLHHRFRFSSLTILLFLILSSLLPLSSSLTDKPSAYEVLQEYNFPVGLLPKGVTGYQLESSTGKFSAYLNGSCGFSLEGSYQLDYKSTIKGYISNGKLSSLEGVKVKLLFLWVNIVEVYLSDDNLEFSVGMASAGFPIDNFLVLDLFQGHTVRDPRP
ncbi:hypothetical protein Nepgr_014980 [Nepenthes gracilis]|uniref:Uncharacterized protein n=1 Tax=Nepenthes gracilis TaxID=150966 RepID=A0AAD3XQQ1_NEPGR|nr:hypothetical protein Nepgr_014980 [Nepenthes gracilis]